MYLFYQLWGVSAVRKEGLAPGCTALPGAWEHPGSCEDPLLQGCTLGMGLILDLHSTHMREGSLGLREEEAGERCRAWLQLLPNHGPSWTDPSLPVPLVARVWGL